MTIWVCDDHSYLECSITNITNITLSHYQVGYPPVIKDGLLENGRQNCYEIPIEIRFSSRPCLITRGYFLVQYEITLESYWEWDAMILNEIASSAFEIYQI